MSKQTKGVHWYKDHLWGEALPSLQEILNGIHIRLLGLLSLPGQWGLDSLLPHRKCMQPDEYSTEGLPTLPSWGAIHSDEFFSCWQLRVLQQWFLHMNLGSENHNSCGVSSVRMQQLFLPRLCMSSSQDTRK